MSFFYVAKTKEITDLYKQIPPFPSKYTGKSFYNFEAWGWTNSIRAMVGIAGQTLYDVRKVRFARFVIDDVYEKLKLYNELKNREANEH